MAQSALAGPVYVLGAGFSRAISDAMPLTDRLGELALLRSRLVGERGVPEDFARAGSFEEWLSRHASPQPYRLPEDNYSALSRYARMSRALAGCLDEAIQAVLAGDAPTWLINFVRVLHAQRATVLTFNYDTLLECALEPAHLNAGEAASEEVSWLAVTAGFAPPPPAGTWAAIEGAHAADSFTLLKLHGSVNWYGVPDDATGASLAARALPGTYGLPQPYDDTSRRHQVPGRQPFIVPPTSTKEGFYTAPLLREIWNRSAQALADTNEAYLVGYSLPTTDLVAVGLLQENLRPGTKLAVVNPDEELPAKLARRGFAEVADESGELPSECVENFVARLTARQSCDALGRLIELLESDSDPRLVVRNGKQNAVVIGATWRDGNLHLETSGHWSEWPLAAAVGPGLPEAMPARHLRAALERDTSGRALLTQVPDDLQTVTVLDIRPEWNTAGGHLLGQGNGRWLVLQTAER